MRTEKDTTDKARRPELGAPEKAETKKPDPKLAAGVVKTKARRP